MDNNSPQQHGPVSLPQPILDNQSDASAAAPAPSQPLQAPPASSGIPADSSGQASAIAQDSDTIEPEWVTRVNNLVQQTVNDPKVLAQEFEKLKSQYIAERYGKEVKRANEKG